TENIFYSESYVYKLIAKVNILFSSLNLKIYFEKNNDMFSLCGNEIEIRYLYYFTISVVAKGTKQYLDLIDSKFSDSFIGSYSKEFNRLSPIGKTRVYYFIAIFSSSISTQNFLPELSDEIKELVCIFTRYNENTNLDASGPPKNRYILNENLVLFCIISYFTQEFYTDFEKSKIGNILSNIKNNHVVDTCKALLQQVCSKYSLDTFTFNLMLYTLCNNMIVIHYLKLYKFMYLKENHYYGSVDTKFIKQCIDLNLTYFTSKEDYAKLKSNFFQIIVSEVSLVPTVKIYIEFFQQPEYKSFIKNT
ncbi:helix-turn-helix domain-containing protein, partial [Lactococcus petauri]